MTVAELVDEAVMQNLALYGCVKNLDAYALHLLKTSQHPILRFRREWMRQTALRQHLDAEQRQVKINGEFKSVPKQRGTIQQSAVIDNFLAGELRHYNNAPITERAHMRAIKADAPAIFPRRE